MNGFPAEGMGTAGAILIGYLGQEYATEIPPVLCKIYGTILNPEGLPVGVASQTLNNAGGVSLIPSWRGVTVTAHLPVADAVGGDIISTDKVSTTTNESGYFELLVIQGLTVTVACASLGKNVSVETAGETGIDLSTFF